MLEGVLLFAAAPTSAFILAVYAARAGHRSGKIAAIVSGLLFLGTTVVTLLYGGWIGPGRGRGGHGAGSRLGTRPQDRHGGVAGCCSWPYSFSLRGYTAGGLM